MAGKAWTLESYPYRRQRIKEGLANKRVRDNVRNVDPLDAYRPDRRKADDSSGLILVYVAIAVINLVLGYAFHSFIH